MLYQFIEILLNTSFSQWLSYLTENLYATLFIAVLLYGIIAKATIRFLVMSVMLITDVIVALPWVACHTGFAYNKSTIYSCNANYAKYIELNFHFNIWYVALAYIAFICIYAHTYSHGIRRGR